MYFSRVRVKPNIRDLSHLYHLLKNNGYGIHQLLWDLFPGKTERYLFREEIAREQLRHHRGVTGEPIYYMVSRNKPVGDTPLFTVESKSYEPKIKAGEQLAFKLRANPIQPAKKDRPLEKIESWQKNRADKGLREKPPTRMRVRYDVVMNAQRQVLRALSDCLGTDYVEGKSAWKQAVFNAWQLSANQSITETLRKYVEENERFREVLRDKPNPSRLFDLAIKAATDKALEDWFIKKGEEKGYKVARDNNRERLRFQAEGYRWHALPKKGRNAGFSSADFDGVIEVTDAEAFVNECLFKGIGPEKAFGCGLMLVRRV